MAANPPLPPHAVCFLRGRREELDANERAILADAVERVEVVPARATHVGRNARVETSTLLLEGFMGRVIEDQRHRRQIVAFEVPGGFPDLHGFPLRTLDHHIVALTDARIASIPHARIAHILEEWPALARKLWYATELDGAMHREWLFRLGRLDAAGRVAHFLCETEARLRCVGLSDGHRYALPITQIDIADVCGLTSIHVNRVIRHLREEGLCSLRAGMVEIFDRPGLAARGEFEPSYLYLRDERPASPARGKQA